jgi:hypothetical protein
MLLVFYDYLSFKDKKKIKPFWQPFGYEDATVKM